MLHGRDVEFPLTPEMEENLAKLITAITPIRIAYGKPWVISSCYRPAGINQSVGGAKASAHMMCQAIDIVDKDGKLADWILNNLDFVKSCGILGIEDPRYTVVVDKSGKRIGGWLHLDIRGVKSGNFVFIPYQGPIKLMVR